MSHHLDIPPPATLTTPPHIGTQAPPITDPLAAVSMLTLDPRLLEPAPGAVGVGPLEGQSPVPQDHLGRRCMSGSINC